MKKSLEKQMNWDICSNLDLHHINHALEAAGQTSALHMTTQNPHMGTCEYCTRITPSSKQSVEWDCIHFTKEELQPQKASSLPKVTKLLLLWGNLTQVHYIFRKSFLQCTVSQGNSLAYYYLTEMLQTTFAFSNLYVTLRLIKNKIFKISLQF